MVYQINEKRRQYSEIIWMCLWNFREVMLEKQLTGHLVDRSICAWFWDQILTQGDSLKVRRLTIIMIPNLLIYVCMFVCFIAFYCWSSTSSSLVSLQLVPVIASPTHYLFQVVRDGITFLACTQVEMPPLMAIEVGALTSVFCYIIASFRTWNFHVCENCALLLK